MPRNGKQSGMAWHVKMACLASPVCCYRLMPKSRAVYHAVNYRESINRNPKQQQQVQMRMVNLIHFIKSSSSIRRP
jgi:hypothetical protein